MLATVSNGRFTVFYYPKFAFVLEFCTERLNFTLSTKTTHSHSTHTH